MIRVVLPAHLRALARIDSELKLDVPGRVTQRSVLDALEAEYPMLRGTMRDHVTKERRAFVRFFACETDLSLESPDTELPDAVAEGREPLARRCPGTERRGSADEGLLEGALAVVNQGVEEARAVAEPALSGDPLRRLADRDRAGR